MGDFYRQVETPLDRAVNKAIDEVNQAFIDDPQAQARARENGDRWRSVMAAEEAAGPYGVVLPMATAKELLTLLTLGEDASVLGPEMLSRMLADAVKKAEARR